MKNPYSKPEEIIYDNSASDMMRFGWVMFEFSLSDNLWIGRDEEGNTWRVTPEQFRDGSISYSEAECDRRWYRCAHPENLRAAKIEMIPRRPVVDYRNVSGNVSGMDWHKTSTPVIIGPGGGGQGSGWDRGGATGGGGAGSNVGGGVGGAIGTNGAEYKAVVESADNIIKKSVSLLHANAKDEIGKAICDVNFFGRSLLIAEARNDHMHFKHIKVGEITNDLKMEEVITHQDKASY